MRFASKIVSYFGFLIPFYNPLIILVSSSSIFSIFYLFRDEDSLAVSTGDELKKRKFDTRVDVLNKSLLRVFKKYYTSQFNDKTGFNSLLASEKSKKYRLLISSFVEDLYGEKLRSLSANYAVSRTELEDHISMIINPTYGKQRLNNKKCLKFSKLFYDVLYAYSHVKLSKIFSNPLLKYMFEDLYNSNVFTEAIECDPTLCRNKELYSKTLIDFKASFEEKRYISMGVAI